ncbi:Fatty-acid and retinol-binding protein 8 [Aphelenchoides besseyi]|nr:Fatty-acid and retinol-binding protein 8 [Aphelenchoides besseyi]KAI6193398.1 Fatty-acid and retinol-binding protein 8 [Aphelenchoides besseyi]
MLSTPLFFFSTLTFGLCHGKSINSEIHDDKLVSFVPEYLLNRLPISVRNDLAQLNIHDALAIRAIAHHLSEYSSIQKLRSDIRKNSPRLDQIVGIRSAQLTAMAADQEAKLKPNTRKYFHEVDEMTRNFGRSFIQLVDRQDSETVEDLKHNFPTAGRLFYSPAGRAIAEYLRKQPLILNSQ